MITPPMHYRSLSFQRGFPDPLLIRRGAELGFNDVCFQTEGGLITMLEDLRDRADRSGYFKLLDELGMTCTVWAHEFADYDYEAWGECRPDNQRLWQGVEQRYDYILGKLLPEIDNLVLTVVETDITATRPDILVPLTSAILRACKRHNTRLILRSFVHHQVRFMVGAVVGVGAGRIELDELRGALEAGRRPIKAKCEAACGLTLTRVDYPPEKDPFPSEG